MKLPTILLVDDTRLLLEIEKGYLDQSPVRILTAQNGVEALEIVTRERPDLILMDQNMPVMNGIQCVSKIRTDPKLVQMPIIMVTNSTSADDLRTFSSAGCTDCLPKPLERTAFLSAIRKYLPAVEQRESRIPCKIQASIQASGRTYHGTIENISLKGVFVATGYRPALHDSILLSFCLPTSAKDSSIQVRSRVAWCNSESVRINSSLPTGFGAEFLEIVGSGLPLLRRSEIKCFLVDSTPVPDSK